MYRNQQLPEQAIRQSNEFMELGKKESALEILFDAIRNKKNKGWSQSLEDVMSGFLSLCLLLRNCQSTKEGIYQYRLICQNTNIQSFESVVLKFLETASDATDKARDQSREKVLAEDLDALETPETILLKSVSETTQQDRSDRVHLSPTVRYMWEALRSILEICKNNKNLERLYAEVAKRAFKFLLSYERKTEFRKLCEVTRMHLQQALKSHHTLYAINLADPGSLDIQMEIRLCQLDTAISLELWMEAFRSMEDIHGLMRLSKKAPHPKILAIFYQKISLVFAKANVPLFHSVALQKLFVLVKEHKKRFTPEELIKISTRVLAATISVPLCYDQNESETLMYRYSDQISSSFQLSSVLGLNYIPNRASLLEDMIKMSILLYATPPLVRIYHALEDPQEQPFLCKFVQQQLDLLPETLVEDLKPYFEPLKRLAFHAFLKRISRYYKCLSTQRLAQLSCFYDEPEVLEILLECSRTGFLKFTLDDETSIIHFSPESFCAKGGGGGQKQQHCLQRELHDCNNLYHDFLSYLSLTINETRSLAFQEEDQNTLREIIFTQLKAYFGQSDDRECIRYQKLQKSIVSYKEKLSAKTEEVYKQQQAKMEEEISRLATLEQKRLNEERIKREEERMKRSLEEKQIKKAREQVSELVNSDLAKKLLKDISVEELEKDPTKYINVHNELRDKEISIHVKKMKRIEKIIECFMYALRQKEQELLPKWVQDSMEERKQHWNKREEERIQTLAKAKKLEHENRERLIKTDADVKIFCEEVHKKALEAHENDMKQYWSLVEEEKLGLLEKRRMERIKQRKLEHIAKLKQSGGKRQIMERRPTTTTFGPQPATAASENISVALGSIQKPAAIVPVVADAATVSSASTTDSKGPIKAYRVKASGVNYNLDVSTSGPKHGRDKPSHHQQTNPDYDVFSRR